MRHTRVNGFIFKPEGGKITKLRNRGHDNIETNLEKVRKIQVAQNIVQ